MIIITPICQHKWHRLGWTKHLLLEFHPTGHGRTGLFDTRQFTGSVLVESAIDCAVKQK